jgi:hypothetical protein
VNPAEIFALVVIGIAVFSWFVIVAIGSAYHNGCNDGYGYSREPTNPGYQRAGEYLREYCAHRWPELKERADGPAEKPTGNQFRAIRFDRGWPSSGGDEEEHHRQDHQDQT